LRKWKDEDEGFGFGLDVVLDGLERRLALGLRPTEADA
jgi:hypothetical protein